MKNLTSIVATLGDLIDLLGRYPDDTEFVEEGGWGLVSWRGWYEQVSLSEGSSTDLVTASSFETIPGMQGGYSTPVEWDSMPPARTVGELAAAARKTADGGVLEGYKGDLFTMDSSTSLWADPWGTCDGIRVLNLVPVGGRVRFELIHVGTV